jgi:hypothetical protein
MLIFNPLKHDFWYYHNSETVKAAITPNMNFSKEFNRKKNFREDQKQTTPFLTPLGLIFLSLYF